MSSINDIPEEFMRSAARTAAEVTSNVQRSSLSLPVSDSTIAAAGQELAALLGQASPAVLRATFHAYVARSMDYALSVHDRRVYRELASMLYNLYPAEVSDAEMCFGPQCI